MRRRTLDRRQGTGEGAVISPLPASIDLHDALDPWAERRRRHEGAGDMIIVRQADDCIVGFGTRLAPDASWTRCASGCRNLCCRCIPGRPG